jgi:predicted HAD superfamily phosphohydrolase YqeG
MNKKKYSVEIWFEKESKLYVITAKKPKQKRILVTTQGKTFVEAFMMLGDAIKVMGGGA